jgi:hypothetical protein
MALENFDATGAWRTKDRGVTIDATGELYDGTKLDGPTALSGALLKYSESFIRNFTESLMTYALGRRVEYFDMPAIRTIVREAARNDNRLSTFVVGIVKSAPFRLATAEAESTDSQEGP